MPHLHIHKLKMKLVFCLTGPLWKVNDIKYCNLLYCCNTKVYLRYYYQKGEIFYRQFPFVSEDTRRWCQTSKGQHGTGRKHLCFPPKYVEVLRSGNPLRAQLEQVIHWDIIISLPATCMYHGNIFPCDAGEHLPAGELKARDYPSLLMRPHQLLHPVLSSLICRKGTSKWDKFRVPAKWLGALAPWGCAEGPCCFSLEKRQLWRRLGATCHCEENMMTHAGTSAPSPPEWLHQSKYLYLCWQ